MGVGLTCWGSSDDTVSSSESNGLSSDLSIGSLSWMIEFSMVTFPWL